MMKLEAPRTVKEMYHRVDPEFKHRLLKAPGGETFKLCYQCGTCTSICPIARLVDVYRPNKIIHLAKLGIRNVAYSDAVWLCVHCNLCTKSCPQGVKVTDIMHALKSLTSEQSNLKDILDNIKKTLATLGEEIPFPVVYSWLGLRPYEEESKRSKFDIQVLDLLQRSLSAYREKKVKPLHETRRERIAIIGSGPAGLTAAWDLAKMGYSTTIFESLPKAGGMLRVGIPEYRLPKKIVDEEMEHLKNLGIEIRTNTAIGKDLSFDHLLKEEGYKAIFIAIGAHKSRKLRVEGEDLEGVVSALDLLRQVNLHEQFRVGKRTIVIGGGNVAMDAARTALRFGAEVVNLFSLESRGEMPAHEWEIQEASLEGVVLNVSWGPKRILGDGKKVTGVEFMRCTSVFDSMGKFNPFFDQTTTKVLEADTVILAIGQSPDLSFLEGKIDAPRGVIAVDPITMETNVPGIFAGGDSVLGVGTIPEAIFTGKTAAASIDRYLRDVNS